MRILNILPYSPCPPHFGGALRIYHLLREMTRSHEVTVIMYGTPAEGQLVRDAFGEGLKEVRTVARPAQLTGVRKRWSQVRSLLGRESATTGAFYSAAMQETIDSVVAGQSFDLIQMENHPLGVFRVSCPGAVRVMDAQNVEHDNVRRMAAASRSPIRRAFYRREARKLFLEEKEVYEKQDAIFVTSSRDRSLMDAEFPGVPKYVIPNGVDTSFFHPSDATPAPHTIVFTGAMNYFPNADGMIWFLREIFPLVKRRVSGARVQIVGGGPPRQLTALASEDVDITGYVEDVRPYVRGAGVYAVPLRMGGGTRLKVLEAMAMERPVVTTTVGCEGINVIDRTSVLVADAPDRFAEAVIDLMSNAALRQKLVANGRDLVRSEYEWSVVGARLNETYSMVTGRGNVRGFPPRHSPPVAVQKA